MPPRPDARRNGRVRWIKHMIEAPSNWFAGMSEPSHVELTLVVPCYQLLAPR